MSRSGSFIEDIDPELEEIYAKLSPKSKRMLRKKIKNKDRRAEHKHSGWKIEMEKVKIERKGREKAESLQKKAEIDRDVAVASRKDEEGQRIEAERKLAAEEAKRKDDEKRQKTELDEATKKAQGFQTIIADDTWTIESNQLAEGSRQHIAERVFCAMTPWLRSSVKGDPPSLAALTSLALQYPGEIQEHVLGFPLADLQVLSDGFQVISDRRTALTHPVKRLLDDDEKRQEGFKRLWNEIIGKNRVSNGLRNILCQSQTHSMLMLDTRRKKRERYENSPAALALARHRNVAAAMSPPPPLIEESSALSSRKRTTTDAKLVERPDSNKLPRSEGVVVRKREAGCTTNQDL